MIDHDHSGPRADHLVGAGVEPTIGIDEPVPVAVRRIVLSLIGGAAVDLRPTDPGTIDAGVHAARKKIKRTRAMLRLVREGIGPTDYRTVDGAFRDIARSISDLRDAAVLVDTTDAVSDRHAEAIDPAALAHTQRWLRDRHDDIATATNAKLWTDASSRLRAVASLFAAVPIHDRIPDGFGAIGPGLRRTYRRGRRDHVRCTQDPTVHHLHEWRKAVKYLRYQLEAIMAIDPEGIAAVTDALDDLGERLGDGHDLAVLAATIRSSPEACRTDAERVLLLSIIDEDRSALHRGAIDVGRTLFAERPSDFEDRMSTVWSATRR